jgi:single-stranded-DNA-specific exonuclease
MRGWTRRWIGRLDGLGLETPPSGGIVDRLLVARGLEDESDRDAFANPSMTSLHHPSTLPGASEAAVRLVEAVRSGRSIAVFGDYDVDGVMSAAILHHVITLVDPEAAPRLYIPHRVDEGYGLNIPALEQLAGEGVKLIISVDCGVTAFEVAERARELGVELIISDHHAFDRDDAGAVRLPQPDLLVHPMRPDAPAPFTDLCGAGVALKIAWAFFERWCNSKRLWEPQRTKLLELFSFAALATIADVVPLVGENRIIVSHGLRLMQTVENPGLKALLDACGFGKPDSEVKSSDVGFRIAPVLNAAGRLGSAEDALALVTTATPGEAAVIATMLVKLNRERQELCKKTTLHAAELAESEGFTGPDRRAIVLADESWNPGLIGICCSRLAEQFGRPVILMQKGDTASRGSARSVPGFSVHAALVQCAQTMNADDGPPLVFGGHDAAAGMTVPNERLSEFIELFVGCANEGLDPGELVPAIEVDTTASLSELSLSTVRRIEGMAPFGAGNPHPRVILEGVMISNPVRMGAGGQHLRARISFDGSSVGAVWWRAPDVLEQLVDAGRQGQMIDLVVEPKINRWQGRENVQLEILDAREHAKATLATA